MTNDIKTKLEYKNNITSYLRELGMLSNRIIKESDLSSMSEINEVRVQSSNLANLPIFKFKINFTELTSKQFSEYIYSLYEINSAQVYLWTNKTNICGLYKANNIKEVDFSFPYDINSEGIIVFLSENLKDKLLLDFSTDVSGTKVVEIESQGLSWPNIKY